jgi:hypothetical protein
MDCGKKTGEDMLRVKIVKPLIKGKKSSKPLIDTGTMRDSMQYIVERSGLEIQRGNKAQRH